MSHWEELSLSLAEFAAHLGRAQGETDLQERYLDRIDRYLPGLGAGIYLLDPDTGEVLDVSCFGVSDYFLARYEHGGRDCDPVFQGVVDSRSATYSDDLMPIARWRSCDAYRNVLHLHRIDYMIQAPILQENRVVGTLNFGRREDQGTFDAGERSLADTLGRVVGTALLSVRERQGAVRRCQRLQAALELVSQPVVVTDLDMAERIANPAAETIIQRLADAGTSLDELVARPGRADGDVVGHEMLIALDGADTAVVRSRTATPVDGVEVSFLDVTPRGEPPRGSLVEPLTPREREVAQLAAGGLTDREIADRLFLSPHTVKGYMKACYRKLGIRSRVALARLPEI